MPRTIRAAQDKVRDDIERNPHRFYSEEFQGRLEYNRALIAKLVNADVEQVAFVRNVTEGIMVALASLPLAPNDEVLTTEHEYESILAALKARCEARGARLVVANPTEDQADGAYAFLLQQMNERTRILFVSHITSSSALQFDIQLLVSEAKRRGITVVVDGAHGPGQIELDLTRLKADIYVGSLHKWAMFPRGSAFIAASSAMQQLLYPESISWYYGDAKFPKRFSWLGTFDPSGWLVAESVVAFQRQASESGWYEDAQKLSILAEAQLCDLAAVEPVGPPRWRAPLCFAVSVRANDLALRQELRAAGVWIWTGRLAGKTIARVSTAIYNTRRDVERLTTAVRGVVGHRSGIG